MKKQLIALLLIAVMTVSVLGAVGVTRAPRTGAQENVGSSSSSGKVPTRLTLFKDGRVWSKGAWYYLFWGVLSDRSGHRLAYKHVLLLWRRTPVTSHENWKLWTTVGTNKDGVYGRAYDKRPGYHIANFLADTVYASAASKVV